MQALHHKRSLFIQAVILIVTCSLFGYGCNKVREDYETTNNLPQVNTTEIFGLPYPDNLEYHFRDKVGYKTTYAVGDTATWVGRFFIENNDLKINVGGADANILLKIKWTSNPDYYMNELVRFVITPNMGIGNNRAVSLTSGGITISAPPITIRESIPLASRTDTTLFVEKMLTWTQDGTLETGNNFRKDLTRVAGDGTIYFGTARNLYKIANGSAVENVLKTNDGSYTDGSVQFTITDILGATPNTGNTALFLSARVQETGQDNNYRVFRVLKMDLETGAVTTLNRTRVLKDITGIDVTPALFEGAIGQLPIVAVDLRYATDGSLFFVNHHPMQRGEYAWEFDWFFEGSASFAYVYPDNYIFTMTVGQLNTQTNQVKTLMNSSGGNLSIGTKVGDARTYQIVPDGKAIYVAPIEILTIGPGVAIYNMALRQLVLSKVFNFGSSIEKNELDFISFDNDTATQYVTPYKVMHVFENWSVLPNGELLSVATNGGLIASSLVATDLFGRKQYLYAGTEKGAFYDMADFDCQPPVPQQVNETGKAKWVDFTGNEECRRNYQLYTAPTTIGFDKDNNMYYFRFTVPGFNGGDSPVRFFKMYSKK